MRIVKIMVRLIVIMLTKSDGYCDDDDDDDDGDDDGDDDDDYGNGGIKDFKDDNTILYLEPFLRLFCRASSSAELCDIVYLSQSFSFRSQQHAGSIKPEGNYVTWGTGLSM